MAAIIYDLNKARRIGGQRSPELDLPKSLTVFAETFGFPLPRTFTSYYLRRTRNGTEVYIKGGRLTLNLSACTKINPANFKAARQWIAAVSEKHGWKMTETKNFLWSAPQSGEGQ